MSTRMTFKSRATRKLKPSSVKVHLTFRTEGKKQKEVVDELSEKLNKAKEFITAFKSYKAESYIQTKMDTIKDTIHKKNYTTEVKGYRCSASCYATLEYGETCVEDLLTLINLSIDKNVQLNYEFNINESLVLDTYDELMAEAISSGYLKVNKIVEASLPFKGKSVEITEILSSTMNLESPQAQEFARVPSYSNQAPVMMDFAKRTRDGAIKGKGLFGSDMLKASIEEEEEYVPERVVTADMIEAMFNAESKAVCEVSMQYEIK